MLPSNLAECVGQTLYVRDYHGRITFGGVVAGSEKQACLALRDGSLRLVERADLFRTEAEAVHAALRSVQADANNANQRMAELLKRLTELASPPAPADSAA